MILIKQVKHPIIMIHRLLYLQYIHVLQTLFYTPDSD